MHYFIDELKRFADFNGRSGRKEFWIFMLILFVADMLVDNIITLSGIPVNIGDQITLVLFLALLLPSITLMIRRLHDTGSSGWWTLFPVVNFLLCMLPGVPSENKYDAALEENNNATPLRVPEHVAVKLDSAAALHIEGNRMTLTVLLILGLFLIASPVYRLAATHDFMGYFILFLILAISSLAASTVAIIMTRRIRNKFSLEKTTDQRQMIKLFSIQVGISILSTFLFFILWLSLLGGGIAYLPTFVALANAASFILAIFIISRCYKIFNGYIKSV